MAYRDFTDEEGRAWVAWDTRPQNQRVIAPGFEDGWLSFLSGEERHRLVPIPDGWVDESVLRLQQLLRRAQGLDVDPQSATESPPG